MGKALSSTEAPLGAHSQDGPILSTVSVPGGNNGHWEQEEQASRTSKAGAKRIMLQIPSGKLGLHQEKGRRKPQRHLEGARTASPSTPGAPQNLLVPGVTVPGQYPLLPSSTLVGVGKFHRLLPSVLREKAGPGAYNCEKRTGLRCILQTASSHEALSSPSAWR